MRSSISWSDVRRYRLNTAKSISIGIAPCRATTWPRFAAACPARRRARIFDAEKQVSNRLVPVRDRPSVTEPTEAQDPLVMERKIAAFHRKLPDSDTPTAHYRKRPIIQEL